MWKSYLITEGACCTLITVTSCTMHTRWLPSMAFYVTAVVLLNSHCSRRTGSGTADDCHVRSQDLMLSNQNSRY